MACCSLQLYQVLETKEASIGGALMGSSQQYRLPLPLPFALSPPRRASKQSQCLSHNSIRFGFDIANAIIASAEFDQHNTVASGTAFQTEGGFTALAAYPRANRHRRCRLCQPTARLSHCLVALAQCCPLCADSVTTAGTSTVRTWCRR